MNLATFRTREEAVFFNSKAGVDIWVGIDDIMKEGYLVQQDGVKVPDLPWASPAPDDLATIEDCIQSGFIGGFNDLDCNRVLRFACETKETLLIPAPSTVAPAGTTKAPVLNTFFKDIGTFGK
jgi:Lectin C-type domain